MVNKNSIIVYTLIGVFLALKCNPPVKMKSNLIANQFSSNFPFIESKDGKFILTNFFSDDDIIIFYNEFTVCSYKIISIDKEGLEDKKINNRQYFIFKKNNQIGYLYDSSMNKLLEKSNVDSLLSKKFFVGNHFEINDNFFRSSTKKTSKDEMIVTYLTKKKINISFPDTSIYYFSKKINNGGLSLNSYMDSLFNSKLYKVRFVFNTSYQEGVLESIPSREFSVEKKEIKLQNENKVINFIERFTKEHPNY